MRTMSKARTMSMALVVTLSTVLATLLMITLSATPAAAAGTKSHHRAASLVAMGDSFSSGEGTFRYRDGTDTATNQCHRSDLAYGALLGRLPGIGRSKLVACSGAGTADIVNPNPDNEGEPAQIDALKRSTRYVTLGVGGNDLGFTNVLTACVGAASQPTPQQCSTNPQLNAAIGYGLGLLSGALPSNGSTVAIPTLLATIAAAAPRAEIALLGYPELFGSSKNSFTTDPTQVSGASCVVNPVVGARLDYADVQWLNQQVRALNAVLQQAAEAAKAKGLRIRYVDPTATFEGHGLCDTKSSWINPLLIGTDGSIASESFHPTVRGQFGYLTAVLRAAHRDWD